MPGFSRFLERFVSHKLPLLSISIFEPFVLSWIRFSVLVLKIVFFSAAPLLSSDIYVCIHQPIRIILKEHILTEMLISLVVMNASTYFFYRMKVRDISPNFSSHIIDVMLHLQLQLEASKIPPISRSGQFFMLTM